MELQTPGDEGEVAKLFGEVQIGNGLINETPMQDIRHLSDGLDLSNRA